jgi:hypothetical protein
MTAADSPTFALGDTVEKVSGYRFPGIVTAIDEAGPEPRYVVTADHPDFAGMKHIFAPKQLKRRTGKAWSAAPAAEAGEDVLERVARAMARLHNDPDMGVAWRGDPDKTEPVQRLWELFVEPASAALAAMPAAAKDERERIRREALEEAATSLEGYASFISGSVAAEIVRALKEVP